jgi:hypothetical protein
MYTGLEAMLTRIVHVKVSAQNTPQDPLKHGHSASLDRTSDKVQVDALETAFSR